MFLDTKQYLVNHCGKGLKSRMVQPMKDSAEVRSHRISRPELINRFSRGEFEFVELTFDEY